MKGMYMEFFKSKAGWTGNPKGEKFAMCFAKQKQWYDQKLARSNQGFGVQYSCVGSGWIWDKIKKKCINLPKCEQKNEDKSGCAKCKQGYELMSLTKFNGKKKWLGLKHYRKTKKTKKWAKLVKLGGSMTKCVSCKRQEVYNIFSGQCERGIEATGLIYYIPPNTDSGTHYVYGIKRPKTKKASAASITFDIDISSHSNFKKNKAIGKRIVIETQLMYLTGGEPCRTPECYHKKRSFKPIKDKGCSSYNTGWAGVAYSSYGRGCPKGTWNSKRVFSDLAPEHKYKNGKPY